jgi:hypothetical protein
MNQSLRLALVAVVPLASACTALADRNINQCSTDLDCTHFEGGETAHAVCRDHVCVNSGLGPQGCFSGTPNTTADFLNACTTAHYLSFDNCSKLGLCGVPLPEPQAPPTGGAATAAVTSAAQPTVRCADAGQNVIYMTGAADFGPLLKQVTPLLSANNPPYRGVFLNGSSCSGVSSVFDPMASVIKDVAGTPTKSANYAFYFDDAGNQVNCTLDPEGKVVDIGVSDLYSTVCNGNYLTGVSVAGYLGPVVTFGLIVPAASQQDVISVEAAHLVFGLGGQNPLGLPASPWTDFSLFSIRNSGAAAVALTAELIHVPRTGFWGVDRLAPDKTRAALEASANPEQSIGIMSIDYADTDRGNLRALHLQAEGQIAGFLPDSTATSKNKANVRDGHYPLWGYVHFYAASLNGSTSAAVQAFVTRFSVPKLDQSLVEAMIDASLVPQCAMKVARNSEMGAFVGNPSRYQCGCFFDYRTTQHASCPICKSDIDCPSAAPTCNYGFCESE